MRKNGSVSAGQEEIAIRTALCGSALAFSCQSASCWNGYKLRNDWKVQGIS